jgi:hypothetical protein
MTIDYTVPTDVTQQKDILYYRSTMLKGNYNGEKSISFGHLLTAVQVKFADESLIAGVSSVTFENVCSTGTLTYKLLGQAPTWESIKGPQSFSSGNRSGMYIADGDYTFLMMPQSFDGGVADNADAALVVNFDDGNKIRKSLSNTIEWVKGHKVTYSINYNGDVKVFDVPEAVETRADATSITIDVVSEKQTYGTDDDGNTVTTSGDKLKWTVESTPNWLTVDTKEYDGTGSVTFNINNTSSYKKGDDEIRKRGTANGIVDLSDGSMNTANCYIVNKAGTYKFPLVYGNALKGGTDNKEAYTGVGYVNHLNQAITSPYIYKNEGCIPHHVGLIWQDKKWLIKSVRLTDNDHYITFETEDANTIGQGNAVIAVYDAEGTIMWSWHIWVTYYIPNQAPKIGDDWRDKEIIPRKTGTRTKYVIMPLNLGWCDDCEYYDGREDKVTLKQTETGVTKTVKVIQRPIIKGSNGSQTFYQWCRKDPFMPADPSIGFQFGKKDQAYEDKASFDINGGDVWFKYTSNKLDLCETIKKPDEFIAVNDGSYRFWTIDNDLTYDLPWRYGVKTIYDPSPVGYMVCERNVLTVVSTVDGLGQKLGDEINTPFTDTGKNDSEQYKEVAESNGWVFYCYKRNETTTKMDLSGGTFFVPLSLYRAYSKSGKAMYNGELRGSGSLWATAESLTSKSGALCLGVGGASVRLHAENSTTNRMYGRAVRCMKE